MAYRNWKQELEDARPPRPSVWPFVLRVAAVLAVAGGLVCAALWVWPGYLLPRPWQRPGPVPPAVAVLFASDVEGYLEPCGCTEQRWGGVARASGYLGSLSSPATRIVLDVGDMTGGHASWQRFAWEHYLTALAKMGALAANLGVAELGFAAGELRGVAERSPVPLVSANAIDAETGEPLVRPYVRRLVDNLRVTVVGIAEPGPQDRLGEGVAVADVDETLDALLPVLERQTDLIVLLAGTDEAGMRRLARAHPELDVVLGGRVAQATGQVERIGDCYLAWQAKKGQMLGRVDLALRGDGQIRTATAAMILLDNDVPEDPAMVQLVEDYNAELARRSRQGGLEALGVTVLPPPAGTNTYVGAESCRACHPRTYAIWQAEDHARAYDSLVQVRRDSNPDCIRCHVVDLGAGDGFRGIAATPERIHVQCEACHGRGADHVRARSARLPETVGRMPDVPPTSCETCHDWTHSPGFSYVTYWQQIEHGPEGDGSVKGIYADDE